MSIRFAAGDTEEFGNALQDVWQNTEIGRQYLKEYYDQETFEEQFDLIRSTTLRVTGGNVSVDEDDIARALYLLITAGHIKPRKAAAAPYEEAPVDTRPRDKNGKLLTAAQIAWGEMTRWANEHSSDECRKRTQTDEVFKNFMQTRLRQEMNVPIGDAVEAIGTVKSPVAASADIRQFALDYTKESSENLRPKGGFVTIAGKQMPYAEFKRKVDEAIASRLIF